MNERFLSVDSLLEYGRHRLGFRVEEPGTSSRSILSSSIVFTWNGIGACSRKNVSAQAVLIVAGSRDPADQGSGDRFFRILQDHPPSVVIYRPSDQAVSRKRLRQTAAAEGFALVSTFEDPCYAGSRVAAFLREKIDIAVTVRGTLVNVSGTGVLIRGRSGSGKSSCALELVSRGHRLVTDDVVAIRRDPAGKLKGNAPPAIKNLIEIKGIGIVNIQRLFGGGAVVEESSVDAVFDLSAYGETTAVSDNKPAVHTLLGVSLPRSSARVASPAAAAEAVEELSVRRNGEAGSHHDVKVS
ncbi:MAG: hypothetical protein AVO39_01925 [delta proteobacterium MLS_D]|jgi:serine kinase of HPr protein (carbohydrate metabolism regulator)|nr:MAG: hypothetical protein AVO39_01925 [delta proteobacterium MLS_D]